MCVEYDTRAWTENAPQSLICSRNIRKRHIQSMRSNPGASFRAPLSFSEQKLRDYLRRRRQWASKSRLPNWIAPRPSPTRHSRARRMIADEYRRFLDVVLDEPAVKM